MRIKFPWLSLLLFQHFLYLALIFPLLLKFIKQSRRRDILKHIWIFWECNPKLNSEFVCCSFILWVFLIQIFSRICTCTAMHVYVYSIPVHACMHAVILCIMISILDQVNTQSMCRMLIILCCENLTHM